MTRARSIRRRVFILGIAALTTAFAGCASDQKSLDELYAIQDRVNRDAPQVDIGAGDQAGAVNHDIYIEEELKPGASRR